MALATGLLVLNMSLFLAEVEALKLLQDRQMTENIAKLLIGAANEEEKDFSGAAEEKASSFKGPSLVQHHIHLTSPEFIATIKYHDASKAPKAISPFLETVSPPPKFRVMTVELA
jgi:hypothetical protein